MAGTLGHVRNLQAVGSVTPDRVYSRGNSSAAIAKVFAVQRQQCFAGRRPMVLIPVSLPMSVATVVPVVARPSTPLTTAWPHEVVFGLACSWSTLVSTGAGKPYRIRRGAFATSIAEDDVYCSIDHLKRAIALGSLADGTFRVWEDAVGVRFELNPATTDARRHNVEQRARRFCYRGASIAFRVLDSRDDNDGAELVTEATLTEISLCYNTAPVDKTSWISMGQARLSTRNR